MMARASLADLRRGEIVDSAIRVLARTGVEGLTMRGLATELGVSTGTITHWFPTKDDVLRASLDEAAERGVEDPRGILRAIADASIPEDEQGREEQRVWLELGARATRVAALAELHDRLYAGWRRRIERAVRRGIDDGSFRVVDTRRWALAYAALIDGLALHVLLHPGIDANEMHRVVEAHLDGTLG